MAQCNITLLFIVTLLSFCNTEVLNDRPIIGVLSQEYYGDLVSAKTYIAASYVKYLETAGARVVPIFVNQSTEYYSKVVKYTNGILFPGGGQYFNRSDSGYGNAGRKLYKLAVEANDKGDYYPVWGTCLGFELLTYLTAGWYLTNCKAVDIALPLDFVPGIKSSRIMDSLPPDVKSFLSTMNVTANYHTECVTPQDFAKSGLDKFYRVLSTNKDSQGVPFVSTMEGIHYPIYGSMWHPEKNMFEFILKNKDKNIPHSYEAVRVAQHFANFFVNEARKNNHQFPSVKMEQESLIYNYAPVYTSPRGSGFEQCYFFN